MRLLPIKVCREGMKLGRSVYNEDGVVLLGKHYELNESMIRRLEGLGIHFLYIEDPRTDDIQIVDLISEDTRKKSISTIRFNFRKLMEENNRRRSVNNRFISKDFRNVATMIIDDLSSNQDAMIMLTNMNIMDLYLYQHSLNVCIYATMLGLAHGYNREDLMTLSVGSLLHDIGKTQIPMEILQKQDNLSKEEYEEIKRHTELGFKLLKDEPNISLLSAHCALQHHERLNGSGYPRGLRGDEIHEFAQWIGLVDTYDAMTTHRVYRPAMLPHQAMEIIYTGTGSMYDKKKIELFRDRVAIYPLGITVGLNTGESGVVVDLNSSSPQRPVVRILQDADGQEIDTPYELDLSKKLSLMVTSVNAVDVMAKP